MQNIPKAKVIQHGTLDSSIYLPKDFFRFKDNVYCGVQVTSWQNDEQAWDSDKSGRWRGAPVIATFPARMNFDNSTVTIEGYDNVHKISSGEDLIANWSALSYVRHTDGTLMGTIDIRIYNAMTGELVRSENVNSSTTTFNFGTLEDGSYLVWLSLFNVNSPYELPPDYSDFVTNTSQWQYLEDGQTYVYDPYYAVGRIPSDPNHPFLLKRDELVAVNAVLDRPHWAKYLTSGGEFSSEWSCCRLLVGSGAWEYSESYVSAPGAALVKSEYDLEGNGVFEPVVFDPNARSISASTVLAQDITDENNNIILAKGTLLIAGRRSNELGPQLSLWTLDESGQAELLGMNTNPSTGLCECFLEDHSATDIVVYKGEVYILTKCSLHKYVPNYVGINNRIPGIPESSDGHPGGSSLREVEGRLFFFTEYFSGDNNPDRIHFYNSLVEQKGERRELGPGTVFHGANCAEAWFGKLWGIQQDSNGDEDENSQGNYSEFGPRQILTWYNNHDWEYEQLYDERGNKIGWFSRSGLTFYTSDFFWQRLKTCNNKMFLFGKEPKTEKALAGIGTGTKFQMINLPYRVRRITSYRDVSKRESLFTFGKKVENGDDNLNTLNWELIEILDEFDSPTLVCDYCVDGICYAYSISTEELEDLNVTPEFLPKFLTFEGKGWLGVSEQPVDKFYLQRHIEEDSVTYYAPSFLRWSIDDDCYKISKEILENIGVIYPFEMGDFAVFDSEFNSFVFTNEAPSNDAFYLIKNETSTEIQYLIGDGFLNLPYSVDRYPNLDVDLDGLYLMESEPPHDDDCDNICNVIVLDLFSFVGKRHKIVDNVLVSCDPQNASEVGIETYQVVVYEAAEREINSISIRDIMSTKKMEEFSNIEFSTWGRIDSDEDQSDLSTYTIPLDYNRVQILPQPAKEKLEVVFLVPSGFGEMQIPVITKRN